MTFFLRWSRNLSLDPFVGKQPVHAVAWFASNSPHQASTQFKNVLYNWHTLNDQVDINLCLGAVPQPFEQILLPLKKGQQQDNKS